MPKETSDIRDFLKRSRQQDAKYVKIKKDKTFTKFKLRMSRVSGQNETERNNNNDGCATSWHGLQ